jgi:phosphonopyruvate decarboxylase
VIAAADFLAACRARDLTFFSGTPCSYLTPLINAVIDDRQLTFRDATNEGDAVAMAAGAYVATGRPGVVMFQNSGLGNAVNALTSLCHPFRIPVLVVVTHRGQPGGPPDEPQHELMGAVTTGLLDAIRLPHEPFPQEAAAIDGALDRALARMREDSLPCALVMPHGSVAPTELHAERDGTPLGSRLTAFTETLNLPYKERPTRAEALAALRAAVWPDDVLVATTGYTGRELYTLGDADNQLYVVGSMGSASSFALGLALHQPERRVFVADGDGAALMRMGNLASIGAFSPENLLHLVLDNEAHDSTGGQATVSRGVSFGAIALACGYARATGADSVEELRTLLDSHTTASGPTLVHFRIRTGTLPGLARPKIRPDEVRLRLMRHLGSA